MRSEELEEMKRLLRLNTGNGGIAMRSIEQISPPLESTSELDPISFVARDDWETVCDPPKDGTVIEIEDGFVFYNPAQDKWRIYSEGYLLGECGDWKPTRWRLTDRKVEISIPTTLAKANEAI